MARAAHRPTIPPGWSVGAFVGATVYVFLLLGLLVWVVLPALLLGLRPVVVMSDSMAPGIRTGDVVMTQAIEAPSDLEVGEVITFRDRTFDRLVTHRIVEVTAEGYVTRGDANADEDPGLVAHADVTGRGRLLVPFLGLPVVWSLTGHWALVALWLVVTAFAVDRALRVPEAADDADPSPDGARPVRTGGAPPTTAPAPAPTLQATTAGPAATGPPRLPFRPRYPIVVVERTSEPPAPRPAPVTDAPPADAVPAHAVPLVPRFRLALTQLLVVVTLLGLVVALPRSTAAFSAPTGNTGNAFEAGTWAIATPTTYWAQLDGTWTQTPPTAASGNRLRLDPGDRGAVPLLTTTAATTLQDPTTLEVFVRRRGRPGPRTLHVALTWAGGPVLIDTVSAVPSNSVEAWTFTLPTSGVTIPAGVDLLLAYELDSTSAADLEIRYGGLDGPTRITFPDAIP